MLVVAPAEMRKALPSAAPASLAVAKPSSFLLPALSCLHPPLQTSDSIGSAAQMALRVDLGVGGSLFSLAFNQDCSCCSIADFSGIRIWNLCTHQTCLDLPLGAISLARMLFCTSLVAFVGAGEQPHLTPRKLTLLNTHSNSVIQSLSFPSAVLDVHLNRKRLVAVLERRTFVYDLESLQLLGTVDTPPNPRGLAALTTCSEPACLLALPAEGGAVRVYDVARPSVEALCQLDAHKSPVTVLAWDDEGALLATASKKGTVVRVHSVRRRSQGEDKALEFRRGSTPATITCLAFSPASVQPRLLCAASDHGSIHIFRLQPPGRHPAAAAAKSLLSAVMPGVMEPQRPLATVRLPGKACASICAVRQEGRDGGSGDGGGGGEEGDQETRLVVAAADGMLHSFRLQLPAAAGSGGRGTGGSGGGSGGSLRVTHEGEWRLAGVPGR